MKTVPVGAKQALAAIKEAKPDEKSDLASAALAAVGFPKNDQPTPLASELDDAQLAVARAVAPERDVWVGKWAMPQPSWSRLRWIGLEPPGVLEKPAKRPLFRVLEHAYRQEGDTSLTAFAKVDLPLADRLDAFGDIAMHAYPYVYANWERFDELRGDFAAAWAKRTADRAVAALASPHNDKLMNPRASFTLAILLGLARGKVPFDPKWSVLVNPFGAPERELVEALKGVSEPHRTRALVDKLSKNVLYASAETGLALLPHFPSAALAKVVLEKASDARTPKAKIVAGVSAVAAKHDAVQAALDAFKGRQPKPLHLAIAKEHYVGKVTELKKTQRAQVLRMFERWDGQDLSLEERFAGGEGGIRIRELVDAKGKRVYDAVSFNADDGLVFRANEADEVAHLVQHGVECDDERLYDALREALVTGRAKKRR